MVDLANRLGVQLNTNDMSVSYRVGVPKRNKINSSSRPILAKFVRRDDKVRVMKSRKSIPRTNTHNDGSINKYKNVHINEDLTSLRNSMRLALLEDEGIERVGVINGKIICGGGREEEEWSIAIDTPEDLLTKLRWRVQDLEEQGLTADFSRLTNEE